jgi:hypothetical protein
MAFANALNQGFASNGGIARPDDRGLALLNASRVPTAICEVGFLTNKQDLKDMIALIEDPEKAQAWADKVAANIWHFVESQYPALVQKMTEKRQILVAQEAARKSGKDRFKELGLEYLEQKLAYYTNATQDATKPQQDSSHAMALGVQRLHDLGLTEMAEAVTRGTPPSHH